MTTLYDRLGVGPADDGDDLRRAYRARARALHPDRAGGRSGAELEADTAELARLNQAWRVLSDPRERARYDAGLASGNDGGVAAAVRQQRRPKSGGARMPAPVGPPPALARVVRGAGRHLRGHGLRRVPTRTRSTPPAWWGNASGATRRSPVRDLRLRQSGAGGGRAVAVPARIGGPPRAGVCQVHRLPQTIRPSGVRSLTVPPVPRPGPRPREAQGAAGVRPPPAPSRSPRR